MAREFPQFEVFDPCRNGAPAAAAQPSPFFAQSLGKESARACLLHGSQDLCCKIRPGIASKGGTTAGETRRRVAGAVVFKLILSALLVSPVLAVVMTSATLPACFHRNE